ncbi:MAG: CHASE3 domain-containing protein [Gemmatimonadales bacterium]|jgi:CHASE3 domain sensor protein
MTLSLRTRIAAAFAVALALIGLVGAAAYRNATETLGDVASLREARNRLDAARAFLQRIADIQAGTRGFVITGRDEFLAPRDSALPYLPATLRHLRDLEADDPSASGVLDSVERFVQARLAFDSQTVLLRRTRGAAPAAALVATGRGKMLMDGIRRLAGGLESRSTAERGRRFAILESSARQTQVFALLGGVLGLVAILAAGWSIFHELAARERAQAEVKVLGGLLPICANCKKIRDDRGYWNQIESYVHEHSEADFSHGICPECAAKLYPEYAAKV